MTNLKTIKKHFRPTVKRVLSHKNNVKREGRVLRKDGLVGCGFWLLKEEHEPKLVKDCRSWDDSEKIDLTELKDKYLTSPFSEQHQLEVSNNVRFLSGGYEDKPVAILTPDNGFEIVKESGVNAYFLGLLADIPKLELKQKEPLEGIQVLSKGKPVGIVMPVNIYYGYGK